MIILWWPPTRGSPVLWNWVQSCYSHYISILRQSRHTVTDDEASSEWWAHYECKQHCPFPNYPWEHGLRDEPRASRVHDLQVGAPRMEWKLARNHHFKFPKVTIYERVSWRPLRTSRKVRQWRDGAWNAVTHNLLQRDPGNPICTQLDCSGPRWHSDF